MAEPENEQHDESGHMRLQKFLAMAGVDSRRNCEEYIRTGRVTVESEVVTDPARSVGSKTQDIRLDGERLRLPRFRYFLVNKPKGVLCTSQRTSTTANWFHGGAAARRTRAKFPLTVSC